MKIERRRVRLLEGEGNIHVAPSCWSSKSISHPTPRHQQWEARTQATNERRAHILPGAMAAAAAALATPTGLLKLPPSYAPPSSPSFGTTYGRRSRRQPRLCRRGGPLLAVAAGDVSYTEPEEALLEALVGVQGRGRAVAPRQLQARNPPAWLETLVVRAPCAC